MKWDDHAIPTPPAAQRSLPAHAKIEMSMPTVAQTLHGVQISAEAIEDFCRRWKIVELALFGSILSPEFRPDSDIEVLVTFSPDAQHSLFDLVTMQDELAVMFGREVDLVEKQALRNPFRRKHILEHSQVIYAA